MADFFQILKANIDNNPPQYGDGTSVLTMLYEAYSQSNQMVNIPPSWSRVSSG